MLLACENPEKIQEIYALAEQIKKDFYGTRIVMFAPLYLSNYCVNGCTYCPYHAINKHIPRKKLTQEEIRAEVIALQDQGHKRLALEAGEDPIHNPIEYILESIQTIYSIKHKNGAIRRVNVNIAATTVENYRKLHDAGIGTYILFQETYHKESYEQLHPWGPKHDYAYHTEAMDRAMEGGIDDVGELGELRVKRTKRILNKTDIAVLVVDATAGPTTADQELITLFREKELPYLIVYNKSDLISPIPDAREHDKKTGRPPVKAS